MRFVAAAGSASRMSSLSSLMPSSSIFFTQLLRISWLSCVYYMGLLLEAWMPSMKDFSPVPFFRSLLLFSQR
jgi:hypothetical protein